MYIISHVYGVGTQESLHTYSDSVESDQGRRQRGGGRGGDRPPNIPVGGASPPNKIGAMTTECVLLLHALDAFQNALYATTRIYTRADYSSSSPSLYCKLRNACAYVLASRSHAFSGEGVAPRGYMWYRQSRPPNSELLPPPLQMSRWNSYSL